MGALNPRPLTLAGASASRLTWGVGRFRWAPAAATANSTPAAAIGTRAATTARCASGPDG